MGDDALRQQMEELFAKEQIVYLTNTGATKMADLRKYIDFLMHEETSDYVGGGNNRHRLEPYFYETGAPREAHLHFHHEMTYTGKSITRIAFASIDTLGDGLRGATYLCECLGMHEDLMKTELGRKLKEKMVGSEGHRCTSCGTWPLRRWLWEGSCAGCAKVMCCATTS